MRHSFFAIPAAICAFAAPMLASSTAAACDLTALQKACGVTINTNAKCTVQVQGGCQAYCTPVSCSGGCNANIDVGCEANCEASCKGGCNVNPGSFDCEAACEANIDAQCNAKCNSNGNSTQCKANCRSAFQADCHAQCNVTPPSADCDVKCKAECDGNCHAQANIDCQIGCQGGCDVQCQDPKGAIFCDGQFIQAGSVDDCEAAIQNCSISLDLSAEAHCSGNQCTASGSASVGCNAGGTEPSSGAPWLALGTVAVGLALTAARRRVGG